MPNGENTIIGGKAMQHCLPERQRQQEWQLPVGHGDQQQLELEQPDKQVCTGLTHESFNITAGCLSFKPIEYKIMFL